MKHKVYMDQATSGICFWLTDRLKAIKTEKKKIAIAREVATTALNER